MRKSNLLAVVLSLFLQVPALITWAQTVSVSGNVYEKGTVKSRFTTPQGSITTILPDDMMAGEVISGTVLLEPTGENERKRNNNYRQLEKYTLSLADGTPLRKTHAGTSQFKSEVTRTEPLYFSIPACASSLSIRLKDPDGNTIGEAKPPLVEKPFLMPLEDIFSISGRGVVVDSSKTKPRIHRPVTFEFKTDKTIYLSGENALLVFTPLLSNEDINSARFVFYGHTKTGEEEEYMKINLRPVVITPRKAVLEIPKNVFGPGEIIIEDENKKSRASAKLHVLKLEAVCPKTSLLKGETTVLNVRLLGLQDCPAKYIRLSLSNQNTGTVQLGDANQEQLILDPATAAYSKVLNEDNAKREKSTEGPGRQKTVQSSEQFENNNVFSLQRPVYSLQSGVFTLNASLFYPSVVYNDPWRLQLDALKTPEEFTAWQEALKYDLISVYGKDYRASGIPIPERVTITKVISFEFDKATVYNKLMLLQIPGDNYLPGSVLEAGKAAVENAINEMGTAPVHYEIILAALKVANQQADIAKNQALKDSTDKYLKQELWKLQQAINRDSEQFQLLTNIQKSLYEAAKAAIQNMRDGGSFDAVKTVRNKPHPVNDLVAVMDPFKNILYALPEYIQTILSQMKAQPATDSKQMMRYKNQKGEMTDYVFSVQPATHRQAYEKSAEILEQLNAMLCQAHIVQQDPPRKEPELIDEVRDYGDRTARYYRNARCEKLVEGFEGECRPCSSDMIREGFWTDYYKKKNPSLFALYCKLFTEDYGDCVGGDGFCLQRTRVVGQYEIYDNINCKGGETLYGGRYIWVTGCWEF